MIQKLKCKYVRSLQNAEKEATGLKVERSFIDQTTEKVDAASKRRESLKVIFMQEINGTTELIKMDKNGLLKSQVMAGVKDAKMYLEKCKEAHLVYTSSPGVERRATEDAWINETYSHYVCLNQNVYKYLETVSESEAKEKRS